jgi:hypothetical protein
MPEIYQDCHNGSEMKHGIEKDAGLFKIFDEALGYDQVTGAAYREKLG